MNTLNHSAAFLVLSVLSACGQAPVSNLQSGSSVNNGPGPVGEILHCRGIHPSTAVFDIRHTAAVTLISGILQRDGSAVSMTCATSATPQGASVTSSSLSWNCTECRQGNGRIMVKVYGNNPGHRQQAEVLLERMFPLPPQQLEILDCRMPTS